MDEFPYPLTVEGPWPATSTKILTSKLQIYFQSRKKSQGGDCEVKICEQSGIATVRFKSEETRDQVLAKGNHSINIEKQVVKLKVFKPSEAENQTQAASGAVAAENDVGTSFQPPVGAEESPKGDPKDESSKECLAYPPQSSAVVLEKLPIHFSRDTLVLLVENISDLLEDEFDLEIIVESNCAVVTFNNPSVSEKFLMESRNNKKFQQYGIVGRALENSRRIKVESLPNQASNKDLLELYFEKWGGAVETITMIPEEQSAIVTFHSHDGVQKVLGKEHNVGQTSVNVYPYFMSLGTALYGKDRPTWSLPKPFTEKIHPALNQFLHQKGLISSICDQMSSYFCELNMDKAEVQISPLPTLLKQKGLTKTHIDGWMKNALDGFQTILSNYAVFEHAVMPSMWATVEKDIRSVVKDKAFLNVNDEHLTLAGMAQDINLLKPILEDFLKKALNQMERDKNTVSETMDIPAAMFSLLLQEGLQHTALAKYPELKHTHKKDTNQLTLQGLSVEIFGVKNWILEKRLRMKDKPLKMDASLLEFLKSADSDELSGHLFTSKGISSVYKVENGDVVLTGSTDSALAEAEKRIHMMLQCRTLSLEDKGVLEKPEWRSLRNNLIDSYNSSKTKTVIIIPSGNKDTLVVTGFKDPVSEVSSNLEMFINKHSRIEKVIRVKSCAVLKFINEKNSEAWAKFVKPNEVKVHFDPRRPLIRLSGERVHVQPVMENFQKMAQSLHTDTLTINKAGAKKYFQEQENLFLIMIKEHRFVIVLAEGDMLEEDEEDEDHYDSGRLEDFGQLSCKVQLPDGVTITVRKADICKFKVDAVVNAANEDLKHIGGLAFALLKAAGPSLQDDSDRYVAVNGKVQPGNAITTGAGRLPCKYVVHAVGPRYSDTDSFTAVRRLRQAVRESLKQAIEKQCTTIAVPAISSGIFGFPLELCSQTIAKELYAYVEAQSHQGGRRITEIHLVDNNANTVNAMAQAIRKEFADFNPEMMFLQQTRSGGASNRGYSNHDRPYRGRGNRGKSYRGRGAYGHQGAGPRSKEPDDYKANEPMETDAREGLKRPNSNQLSSTLSDDFSRSGLLEKQSTQEGLRINLRKGNIQDATSDVIVNTISEDGDLSSGAVSKALLGAAGPQLQSEASSHLDSFGSSKLNYGDIVVTAGYNLNCQRVFHTVCPFWNRGADAEAEHLLKQIIRDCLKRAEHQKMSSLSFPALGTGNLRFPKDLVSSILLREIHDFSARFTPQHLQEVTVVVHPSDNETVQCFIKSFRGGKPGPITKRAQAGQQPSHTKSPAKSSQSPGLFGVVSTPTLGVHRVQVGHLTLEVSSGDITKERIDAIVNSSNSSFTLKAGVSKAILDAAGSTVELECAQIVQRSLLQQNELIVTSGGRLPCKHIIHVIGRNNAAAIKDVVYSVLKLCETQKFSSVAFPALGTGQGGISASAVADAMIDAVVDFVKKKKGQHLQSVKFLIFQTSMVPDFHQTMLRRQQEGVEEETGVLNWIKGKFEAVTSIFYGSNSESSANEEFVMVEEEFEPAVFQLCGESQQDLNEAKELINSFIVKEHNSSTVRDSAINHFTREDAEILSNLQRELAVSIQLNKSGQEPVITVEGLTRDVMKVESIIRDMIRKVEKNESRKREAFMVGSMVEWQYLDSRKKLIPFDYLTNYDLEEAFGQKQPRIKIKINNEPYEVNIAQRTAVGKHQTIELKRVDRRDKTSVPLPSHWEDMKGSFVKRVQIQPGTQEYTDVENEFRRTGLNNTILEIERVQNSTLWRSYMIQKNHLDEKNKHKNNEKKLFHGTGSDNIDTIDKQGFNRSYAGMHGAMYGNGAYFAVDPNYSQGYAKQDRLGHKRMYLARVLVGDYTTGKAGLLSPPAKSSSAADLYDSVTDNHRSPSMFVIFHDVQAYPEYLITFQ
ncbi:protein mono-ADP-ribosyltransferase PARP14 [Astyanax mexicanus]|uniref:protein mono-ADP-ribosyltransferase PARP14 n=1 Tax=Astyanax mexicanus TaxID=7994 RepID=UPI0020CAFD96|nr:protein mono-ADP-ribosyltransferase PARP14 [Astyanax mexicanus]